MAEDIKGPSVPYLQGKPVLQKVHNVEPVIVLNGTEGNRDRYNSITLFCDLMHINSIGFPNTIYQKILFTKGSMVKIEK